MAQYSLASPYSQTQITHLLRYPMTLIEAASPTREIVRTKKKESGSSRTAQVRKGMAEAIEAVNGSDATNPLIPQCNAEDTCLGNPCNT
jgi:hypothetical protein